SRCAACTSSAHIVTTSDLRNGMKRSPVMAALMRGVRSSQHVRSPPGRRGNRLRSIELSFAGDTVRPWGDACAPSGREPLEEPMSKFVFAYRGGGGMAATPEAQEKAMAEWGAWFGSLGAALVDGGSPFGAAATVRADGGSSDGG